MKESTVACRVARILLNMDGVVSDVSNGKWNTSLWEPLSRVC